MNAERTRVSREGKGIPVIWIKMPDEVGIGGYGEREIITGLIARAKGKNRGSGRRRY